MKKTKVFLKVALLAWIPSLITMLFYIGLGEIQNKIPSILLFFICGVLFLFPFELYIIYKNKGNLLKKSKIKWWQLILLVGLLIGLAGLMSAIITPLEHSLLSNIIEKINSITPDYFNWNPIHLANYSNVMVVTTCGLYFIFNVIICPVIEEFFFRGVLTNKLQKYGYIAPIFVTIVFSLYHLWLPFDNLFRIVAFILPSVLAYKYKDIRITIGFHCACNLFSTLSFIVSVLSYKF